MSWEGLVTNEYCRYHQGENSSECSGRFVQRVRCSRTRAEDGGAGRVVQYEIRVIALEERARYERRVARRSAPAVII